MKIFKMRNLYALIYIGVICALVYFYFSGKDVSYYQIENLSITETASIEFPLVPKRIKSLSIDYKGLYFKISGSTPVKIISGDNIIRSATVEKLEIIDNNLRLQLANQVELNLLVDKRGNRLTITSSIPKVFPTITEVIIPYELRNSLSLKAGDLSYKIYNNQNEFHLKLNDLYYVDSSENNIHLIAEDDKIKTLTFSPLSNSDLPLAEQWYSTIGVNNSINLDKEIENYLSKVTISNNRLYNPIRFNESSETWSNLPSITDVTEESVVVYLADALRDGTYTSSKNRIIGLVNKYPHKFGFYSTPFMGNIVRNGRDGLDEDSKTLANIRNMISKSDELLLKTWIDDHYFIADNINIRGLESFISGVNMNDLELSSELILLNNLLHILDAKSASTIALDLVKQLTDSILEKIFWDDTGTHLIDSENISNMVLNLKAGKLLIKASQHESSEYSKPIGEALIETYIKNSQANGAINSQYDTKDKRWLESYIPAEDSYLSLSNNPYLPHYYEDNGIKVWTISDSVEISITSSDIRISISYPYSREEERSHFLAISGIEPYKELYFWGNQWRADKNFEKWGVGYYYDQTPKHLYFMPMHKKTREEIVISY